jgi:hypothetical protein
MHASPVSATTFARDGEGSPAGIAGLLLWVRPEAGVATDDGARVLGWRDFSGRGNDLRPESAGGQPVLVPDAAGSLPAVRFDGSDDALLFENPLTTIRTAFWVVREELRRPTGGGSSWATPTRTTSTPAAPGRSGETTPTQPYVGARRGSTAPWSTA